MDELPITAIAEATTGEILQSGNADSFTDVSTDTRAMEDGALFIALDGKNFDAHDFLEEAVDAGAGGVLISTEPEEPLPEEITVILVDDTLQALQDLASYYRSTFHGKVIGITGSNGKTSTKDMVDAVLSGHFQVTKTQGNLNNHIGLPLSILSASAEDDFCVFEMGMNHAGEISTLADISKPDIGIVTNAGTAHIEFMGSREAIAREKGDLPRAIPADGNVILQTEENLLKILEANVKAPITHVGLESGDFVASQIEITDGGSRFVVKGDGEEAKFELGVPGVHMVRNALLAIATGKLAGLSLKQCAAGLRKLALTGGRLETKSIDGMTFLDDSYNANPDSVVAALEVLAAVECSGRKIAVLGAMGELGDAAEEGYRAVGQTAAKLRIDVIISCGDEAQTITKSARQNGAETIHHCADNHAVVDKLQENVKVGDVVLLKGSRSAKLEEIITIFKQSGETIT